MWPFSKLPSYTSWGFWEETKNRKWPLYFGTSPAGLFHILPGSRPPTALPPSSSFAWQVKSAGCQATCLRLIFLAPGIHTIELRSRHWAGCAEGSVCSGHLWLQEKVWWAVALIRLQWHALGICRVYTAQTLIRDLIKSLAGLHSSLCVCFSTIIAQNVIVPCTVFPEFGLGGGLSFFFLFLFGSLNLRLLASKSSCNTYSPVSFWVSTVMSLGFVLCLRKNPHRSAFAGRGRCHVASTGFSLVDNTNNSCSCKQELWIFLGHYSLIRIHGPFPILKFIF